MTAKNRHLLKAPLPKMPPSSLPPPRHWPVTGPGEEDLHRLVFAAAEAGVDVFDAAGTPTSTS